jgi:iron complex transport system substrate-binding protein
MSAGRCIDPMKRTLVIGLVLIAFVASYYAQQRIESLEVNDAPSATGYQRIVSLAPSITETLYALDLGDRIIGVTNFCDYPEAATTKAKVGGIIDTNYEAILHLEPDVVILYPVHHDAQRRLKELGVHTLTVDCRTLDGILESVQIIGEACHVTAQSDAILATMHAGMERIRSRTEGLDKPTVLISAGRTKDSGKLGEVYAAGRGQWYDDAISIAGGENVFTDDKIPFPSVSGEGLVRLNPDVIVEMAPSDTGRTVTAEQIAAQWNVFPDINAVHGGRVYVLEGNYTTIPGPRFVMVVEDLARVLHPEVDWDTP